MGPHLGVTITKGITTMTVEIGTGSADLNLTPIILDIGVTVAVTLTEVTLDPFTKWNYYLQGTDIIVRNDHKPLAQFLNGKNTNNKVNRWSVKLSTYNISFKWISGAKTQSS